MQETAITTKQELALELALAGLSDTAISKKLALSRQTVNFWRNQDPAFRNELESRRAALRAMHLDRLGGLAADAIAVLRDALNSPSEPIRLRAAAMILRALGLDQPARADASPGELELLMTVLSQAINETSRELGLK